MIVTESGLFLLEGNIVPSGVQEHCKFATMTALPHVYSWAIDSVTRMSQ